MADGGGAGPGNIVAATPEDALKAVESFLNTHEIRVLGVLGIFIGYICVFFVKILSFTNIFMGVGGVALTALILMFLDPKRQIGYLDWWFRVIVVVLMSLFLTAPQLYFAWTV